MNSLLIFSLINLILVTNSFARLTDDQDIVKVVGATIEVSTKPGFHLNAEAPANVTYDDLKAIYKPLPKTEKLFVFQIPGKVKQAKLSFYVCDDKKTACEQHQEEVHVNSDKAQSEIGAKDLSLAMKKDKVDVSSAKTKLSTNEDKPTLLIFSAPWCPACIRMQTEVYPQKAVQNQFKKIQVQKLNNDLPENYELVEKYRVRAIPTLILVNQQGEEIYRWLDFQPADQFSKDLESKIKSSVGIAELEKKANLGDHAAISQMGMNAFNTMNCEQAIKWLSQSKKIVDLNYKLSSEVSCAEDRDLSDQKNLTEYLNTLQKAITMSLSQLDQYRWTTDWIEKLKEKGTLSEQAKDKAKITLENFSQLLKNNERLAEAFSESTFGEVGRFAKEEVLLMKARLYGALDFASQKEDAFKQVVAMVNKNKLSTGKPGEMLLAIAYLREANEKKTVEKLYQQLLAKYPATYVYHEKYGRYLLKEKNLQPALEQSETALKFPEGNEPQLYLLKARILNEMNSKKSALNVLDQALAYEKISHPKYKKTVASIEKLKKDLISEVK